MISLRNYQKFTVESVWDYLTKNPGDPCVVLPTGAGKSIICAELCKSAIKAWPKTRILMVVHTKELIEQNAKKLREHWPNAPLGVFSAGLNKKEIDQITFGGIQSIRTIPESFFGVDMVIVDECHLISHKEEGGYRFFLGTLKENNPNIRIVGMTATPYRLGHGLITDKPGFFDDLIEPVGIVQLQHDGFLADLRSKVTGLKLDVSGVGKSGGEFIESELQAAVDTELQNAGAVDEVIKLAGERRSWLFFCAGVDHAVHVKEILESRGIASAVVTGETPSDERARILEEFKAGKIKALTNANVLTTGFDAPNIDLIAMMRPTCSASLYVQMAGRGLRKKDHTDHCLILDFAGVVSQHGPITAVRPPKGKKSDEKGIPPSKECPQCGEILAISARQCTNPDCLYFFPVAEKVHILHDDDIMGRDLTGEMDVKKWIWKMETSKKSGIEMLVCSYFHDVFSMEPIKEYFCINHEGYAKNKAFAEIGRMMKECGCTEFDTDHLNNSNPPEKIFWKMEKGFKKITKKVFEIPPF